MKRINLIGNTRLLRNFKQHAMEHDLWYNPDGSLATWEVAFHGLGFKSYDYAGGKHWLDDAEYTWFMLRYG